MERIPLQITFPTTNQQLIRIGKRVLNFNSERSGLSKVLRISRKIDIVYFRIEVSLINPPETIKFRQPDRAILLSADLDASPPSKALQHLTITTEEYPITIFLDPTQIVDYSGERDTENLYFQIKYQPTEGDLDSVQKEEFSVPLQFEKTSLTPAHSFTDPHGIEFVLIKPGTYSMGSEEGSENEAPMHQVEITEPFYLSRYPITQAQWEAIEGNNPSRFKGENHPVEHVSWSDVQSFLDKLNGEEEIYRLPTEAEWEYACIAGTTTEYSFGQAEDKLSEYAWYRSNSGKSTHPVGEKKPNPWGLYDMHGNVYEWVQDKYGQYKEAASHNPTGPENGAERVIRGGSWFNGAKGLRSTMRGIFLPDYADNYIGFRVLRKVDEGLIQQQESALKDIQPEQEETPPEPIVKGPERFLTDEHGIEFVLIEPGTFMMGDEKWSYTSPVHKVELTRPYYLGRYPVTQAQWKDLMGKEPSRFKGKMNPVERVSWKDVQKFLKKLNSGESTYQLPTSAQWEYACRAGTTTAYSFGEDRKQLGDYAWYRGNSKGTTHPVGEKQPNPWGLYDMHGNVWEWVQDWSDRSYYEQFENQTAIDPMGPDKGTTRVVRGGGWNGRAKILRSATRGYHAPGNNANFTIGFRLLRTLP